MSSILDLRLSTGSHLATSDSDQSGNGYTPTFYNSAKKLAESKLLPADTVGLSLARSTSDYLQYNGNIPGFDAIVEATTGDATIECYIKFRSLPGRMMILSYYDPGTGDQMALDYTGTVLRFYYWDGAATVLSASSSSAPPTDRWLHLAVVKKGGAGAAEIGIYLDGVQIAYTSDASTISLGATAYYEIGRGIGSNYLDAEISRFLVSDANVYSASPNSGKTDTITPTYNYSDYAALASARQYTAANSEYHSIAHASQTGLNPGDTDFYGCGWFRLDSFVTLNTLFSKWKDNGGAGTVAYLLDYLNSTSRFRWSVTSNTYNSGVTTVNASTFGAASLNTWYFVEWYHDSVNNQLGICVNRGTTDTASHTTGIYNTTQTAVMFGALATNYYNSGKMGPVGVWSRIPSSTERDSLYNSGNGVLYKDLTAGLKTNLISWWDGAETSGSLIDAHGTNHLTDNNTVTSAVGKVTYTAEDASQFTAANSEYLSLADSDDFSFGNGTSDSAFSGSAWVYLTDITSVALMYKTSPTTTSSDVEYAFYVGSTSLLTIRLYDHSTTNYIGKSLDAALSANTWYHVAFTYDGSGSNTGLKLYLNGYMPAQTGGNGGGYIAMENGTGTFRIGNGFNASYLDGRSQMCTMWGRELSASEVLQLFGRGFGLDYSDYDAGLLTSLISHWSLIESSGTRYDSHGSNDLTDNNTVTGNPGIVYDAPVVVADDDVNVNDAVTVAENVSMNVTTPATGGVTDYAMYVFEQ